MVVKSRTKKQLIANKTRLLQAASNLAWRITRLPIIRRIENRAEKIRFSSVGAIATGIDFTILFGLHFAGLPSIAANFISTTTAFCFSFIGNRHFAFRAHHGNITRQIILFVTVTLFGIWVIQPAIIGGVEEAVESYGWHGWVKLAIGKLVATGVTFFWNYYFYSHVVFKKKK